MNIGAKFTHLNEGKRFSPFWIKRVFIWFIFYFWCFNATFSNISAISWRPVLVVEEVGVPGENPRPGASNW